MFTNDTKQEKILADEHSEILLASADKRNSGNLTRRSFLTRATTLGLMTGMIPLLLESCSSSPASSASVPQLIAWQSEDMPTGTYSSLVDTFNKLNSDGIHVSYTQNGDALHEQLQQGFSAQSRTPDVVSLDVIWVDEFASKGWLLPLDDRWTEQERTQYVPAGLNAASSQGHIWAAPFRLDVGLLYYRTDIVTTAPKTWDELVKVAEDAQRSGKVSSGYIWSGTQSEELVCHFIEVLSSYGGSLFSPNDPKQVMVNSPEGVQALSQMVNWIGTVSPADTTKYGSIDTLNQWLQGNAVFMRNWSGLIAPSSDPGQSSIAGKFGVVALPSGAKSCLGGWLLGINTFSKNQDAAGQFIQWMMQEDAQLYAALKGGFPVELKAIYADQAVLQQSPFFAELTAILANSQLRPRSAHYQEISMAIQTYISKALTKSLAPADALEALQRALDDIVANNS